MKTRLRLLIAITIMASVNIVNAASYSAFVNVVHETAESVLASAVQVTAGDEHTCALTITGGVKCWGNNYSGQLGDGSGMDHITPVDVFGLTSGVIEISAGGDHTCALTNTGGVKCWGTNSSGQLGDGSEMGHSTPVDVFGLTSGVSRITVGSYHTCAVMNTGGAKCWGGNWIGQLGDGTSIHRITPVDVMGLTSGVITMSAGGNHTCAVMNTGGVKCWGNNFSGELGDGTQNPRATPGDVTGLTSGVKTVSAGKGHTCAVMNTGGAKCWGDNWIGQLGDGTTNSRTTPVDVSGLTSGVKAITAGYHHTCAVMNTDGVKCWGYNGSGVLGDGTEINRTTPVDVFGLTSGVNTIDIGYGVHTCAVMNIGGVKCWGENRLGKLGDGTRINRITPVDVIGLDGRPVTPTTPAPPPCTAPPIESLTFTPPSGSPVGTVVQISARATSNACFRAMRLRINNQIVNETGSPTLTYNWNTTGYSASGHQIIVEVAAQGDNSWAAPSNRAAIYVLSLPPTTPAPTTPASTTPVPTTPAPTKPGPTIIDSGFVPSIDGFSFQNFTATKPSWDTFKRSFPNTKMEYPDGSRLLLAEAFFNSSYIRAIEGYGVCFGFSQVSQIWYSQSRSLQTVEEEVLPPSERKKLSVHDLPASDEVKQYLTSYQGRVDSVEFAFVGPYGESVDELYSNVSNALKLDSKTLPMIVIGGNVSYPCGFLQLKMCTLPSRHNLLAYKVTDYGDAASIHVYDSNSDVTDADKRVIEIDKIRKSWRYELFIGTTEWGSSKPNGFIRSIVGQHSFPATLWLYEDTQDSARISVSAMAKSQVKSKSGGQIGFLDGQISSTIPGARIEFPVGVNGSSLTRTSYTVNYVLPISDSYILVVENDADSELTASAYFSGQVIGIDKIMARDHATTTIVFEPNSRSVSLLSPTTSSPCAYYAKDLGDRSRSFQFCISELRDNNPTKISLGVASSLDAFEVSQISQGTVFSASVRQTGIDSGDYTSVGIIGASKSISIVTDSNLSLHTPGHFNWITKFDRPVFLPFIKRGR